MPTNRSLFGSRRCLPPRPPESATSARGIQTPRSTAARRPMCTRWPMSECGTGRGGPGSQGLSPPNELVISTPSRGSASRENHFAERLNIAGALAVSKAIRLPFSAPDRGTSGGTARAQRGHCYFSARRSRASAPLCIFPPFRRRLHSWIGFRFSGPRGLAVGSGQPIGRPSFRAAFRGPWRLAAHRNTAIFRPTP